MAQLPGQLSSLPVTMPPYVGGMVEPARLTLHYDVPTTPLGPQHLEMILTLLPQTICGVDAIMKRAGEAIMALEKLPNYCVLLLEILHNRSIPITLRQLSIINLKSVVSKYWRPRLQTPANISNDEKAIVRAKLISFVEEQEPTVVSQVAVLIAQIARLDWPRFWPDLIPTIFKTIQTNVGTLRLHALHILYRVCYAVVSRSPGGNNASFIEITTAMFDPLGVLWQQTNDSVLATLSGFANGTTPMSQVSYMIVEANIAKFLIKILASMIHYGFQKQWNKTPNAVGFMNTVLDRYKISITAYNTVKDNPLTDVIGKYIRFYGKLLLKAMERDPTSFTTILPSALDLCFAAISDYAVNREHEKFIINCLMLIKLSLEVTEYKTAGTIGEQTISQFFSPERQQGLLHLLVMRYFALTEADLNEWQTNPEGFLQDEAISSMEVRQRPCAFAVYSILLRRFTHLAPYMRQALQETIAAPAVDLPSILVKDACYAAISGASYELHDEIDFSGWYVASLAREIEIYTPVFRILRKRIANLIGQWVLKLADELRPTIYGSLVKLLREEDLVVNVAAAEALEFLINDMNFKVDVFLPYLGEAATSLFRLIRAAQVHDTQMRLMTVIGTMIEMIGDQVRPYTSNILQLASDFWGKTTNQDIMRAAVLRLLTKLVLSLGDCSEFYDKLLPVINFSTTIENRDELYLLEDGMTLWLVVARNATTFSQSFLQLFPNLLKVMNRNYGHLTVCMKIIEAYIVLGQISFLSMFAPSLAALFAGCLGDVTDKGLMSLTTPIELLMVMYPSEMTGPLEPAFQKVLSLILSGKETDQAVSHLLVLLGRFLLHNRQHFFDFFQRMTASPQNILKQNLLVLVIDTWVARIDSMPDLRRRKLAAMALSSLLAGVDFVGNFMDTATLVLSESIGVSVDERAGEGPIPRVAPDPDDYIDVNLPELSRLSSQAKQLAILHTNDPLSKLMLRDWILAKLQELSQQAPLVCEALVKRVDPLVFAQLTTDPNQNK